MTVWRSAKVDDLRTRSSTIDREIEVAESERAHIADVEPRKSGERRRWALANE